MDRKITGVMVYYYYVCKRKLWYFSNEITMEHTNEDVALGKIIDETSYSRDTKHICIDDVINIDYIREKNVLHEIKKSNKIEEASIWQVKYYLYYLKKRNVFLKAQIDYPILKKTVEVELSKEDEKIMEEVLLDIQKVVQEEKIFSRMSKPICKKCAYYELCYI